MMRQYIWIAVILVLSACSNNNAEKIAPKVTPVEEKAEFFPVTSFIKGQVFEINEKKLTPIKYTTINGHTDSIYLKFENLDEELKEFLQPEIDSANLVQFFTETKFADQTINTFTFTYEPKMQLPDSIPFRRWDVYIDPETNKVTRVYIVKKSSGNKILQLTWQSGEWCKITTLTSDPGKPSVIEKEEKISWDY